MLEAWLAPTKVKYHENVHEKVGSLVVRIEKKVNGQLVGFCIKCECIVVC